MWKKKLRMKISNMVEDEMQEKGRKTADFNEFILAVRENKKVSQATQV